MVALPAQGSRSGSVPMILLTGFLGAGKTTVLNRVLGFQHHRRVAVLVNELGRVDIDAALIRSRAGDVLELAGGCVCHQIGVQRELWSALDDIVARSRPDVVVLETTGIAEPQAIWTGLDELKAQRAGDDQQKGIPVHRAATVTVVDADSGTQQLNRHEEARAQVLAADRILLSKTDIATVDALTDVHQRLHEINPGAERVSFPAGDAGTAALVPWFLNTTGGRARPRSSSPRFTEHHAHAHAHAHQLAAATFVDDAPLIGDALVLVCVALGDSLVRAKGFVRIAGESRRGFLELAGRRLSLSFGEPWGAEAPMTRLVLIGEDLDQAALQRQIWACRARAPLSK